MKRLLLTGLLTGSLFCACNHTHHHSEGETHTHSHSEECSTHSHEHSDATHHAHSHEGDGECTQHDEPKPSTHQAGLIELCDQEAKMAGVCTQVIEPMPFTQSITVSGTLDFAPTSNSTIVARAAGVVTFASHLVEGTYVKANETLCVISSDKISGGDPIKKNESNYQIARDEMLRAEKLLKEQLISIHEFNEVKKAYEEARIAYESISTQAHAGYAMTSQRAGYVQQCMVQNGDYVQVGQPLFQVVSTDKLVLTAHLPLRYRAQINRIQAATFVTEGSNQVYHTDSLRAKFIPLPVSLPMNTSYLPLRWEMAYQDALLPGSFCTIHLLTQRISNAIVLPKSAITDESDIHYIYIKVDSNHYCKQRVHIEGTDGANVQVGGLPVGAVVVTQGAMSVRQAGMSKVVAGHSHNH